jgi:HK97 family phage portal protein
VNLFQTAVSWLGFSNDALISRNNRDDFETNRVTVADHDDFSLGTSSVLGLAAAWACVNLLAGTIASLPLMVYRTDKQGRRTIASDHRLYSVLHDSPNADQTALDYWEFMSACLELQGDAISEIQRTADGGVIALDEPVPPEIVNRRRLDSGDIEYRWTQNGSRRVLNQNQVLHIRGFGGNSLGGLSTLTFGRHTFGLQRAIDKAARQTFKNGVRSSGAFVTDKPLNPQQMDEGQQLIEKKYVGAMNAGRPLLLNNGMKWQSITINPEDAQMLESRAFGVEEICRLFGVPPFMVGHTEKSTSWGTGIEQQTLGFVKFTLRRRLKRIEQSLSKQLLSPRDRVDGVVIEFNLEGLLRGDSKGRADFYSAALGDTQKPGWMVRNEVRRLENLEPIDGWDEPVPLISQAPTEKPQ